MPLTRSRWAYSMEPFDAWCLDATPGTVCPHSVPGSSMRWAKYTRGPEVPSFMLTRILMLPDVRALGRPLYTPGGQSSHGTIHLAIPRHWTMARMLEMAEDDFCIKPEDYDAELWEKGMACSGVRLFTGLETSIIGPVWTPRHGLDELGCPIGAGPAGSSVADLMKTVPFSQIMPPLILQTQIDISTRRLHVLRANGPWATASVHRDGLLTWPQMLQDIHSTHEDGVDPEPVVSVKGSDPMAIATKADAWRQPQSPDLSLGTALYSHDEAGLESALQPGARPGFPVGRDVVVNLGLVRFFLEMTKILSPATQATKVWRTFIQALCEEGRPARPERTVRWLDGILEPVSQHIRKVWADVRSLVAQSAVPEKLKPSDIQWMVTTRPQRLLALQEESMALPPLDPDNPMRLFQERYTEITKSLNRKLYSTMRNLVVALEDQDAFAVEECMAKVMEEMDVFPAVYVWKSVQCHLGEFMAENRVRGRILVAQLERTQPALARHVRDKHGRPEAKDLDLLIQTGAQDPGAGTRRLRDVFLAEARLLEQLWTRAGKPEPSPLTKLRHSLISAADTLSQILGSLKLPEISTADPGVDLKGEMIPWEDDGSEGSKESESSERAESD